jgi:hypothetical protein
LGKDVVKGERDRKASRRVRISNELDLAPFVTEEAKKRYSDASELKFKLCAVTSHGGGQVSTGAVA